ncbi:MAG: AI-2E family transporter [Limnochordia bacterium]
MSGQSRLVILLAAASGVVFMLYLIRGVLVPFALAAVVAYVFNPLVNAVESRQVPRSGAIVLVYLMFGVAGGLILYVGAPLLAAEMEQIMANLPGSEGMNDLLRGSQVSAPYLTESPFLKGLIKTGAQQVEGLLARLIARSLEVLLAFLARTFTILMVPFLAFYFLRDADKLNRQFISLLPQEHRQETVVLLWRLNQLAGAFLRGQVIVAIIVGLLISVGLALLKVKYALVIGIMAAVFEFIPYFGPAVAAVPAVLFGLMRSPATAFWTVLLIIAVHQVEGAILQPHVMSGTLDLHPLTVIAAVLIGGELLGIWGMFMAVPVAAALKLIGRYVAEEVFGSTTSNS